MKLKDIVESFGPDRVDVAVEYELEYKTPEGDVDYKMLEITGEVIITTDAYDTGDSPTDYEFNVDSITDKETGEAVSGKLIPPDGWKWINNQAYEQATRHL